MSASIPLTKTVSAHAVKEHTEDLDSSHTRSALASQGKTAVLTLCKAGFLTFVVIWVFSVWIYGAVAGAGKRVHRLPGYVVDFDGGAVGQALLASLQTIEDPRTTLGWEVLPASRFTVDELAREVRDGRVWGAIWVPEGRSAAFNASMRSDEAATSYDPTQAITFTAVQARYATTYEGYIRPQFLQLAGTAAAIFQQTTTLPLLASVDARSLSSAQRQVLLSPISSAERVLAPLEFTTRVLLNTFGKVHPVLFQFFFLMALNPIFTMFGLHTRKSMGQILACRYPIKLVWCALTAASSCSFALFFQESDSHLPFRWWVALFAATLAFCVVAWDTIDLLLAYIPVAFISSFVFPLIVVSVAATVFPIELSHNFYRISYLLPSHSLWSLEVIIFGRGATASSSAHIYGPVLAAWVVLGEVGQVLAARKRSRDSWKPEMELETVGKGSH